ncbi:hypothetical protein ACG02S_10350 [Roseateles sp. DC23W]|uniref:Uncharacterized protein n=1 Tax=Pelomonas dachongensis TaxID=3299029 RepID=A0ABW7EQJ7_9BURK
MTPIRVIDPVEVRRGLGHDIHNLSRVPWQVDWPSAVQEGFTLAMAGGRGRPRQDERFVRKWLQLRLNALVRDRSVAPDFTVELLRRLDAKPCPAMPGDLRDPA